ncbi:MAG TPA: VWA domain-containing protein, partial [Bryobacteraceae bacterium]|nr:VWA domain-containing protein [Bryobacteraceae bacterium]
MLRTASALLVGSFALCAQIGQNTSPDGPPAFQSTTQLVIETVTAKDKDGNPVTGLTARDFTLTENGVPQEIRFFEFQKLDHAPDNQPISEQQRIQPLARLTRTQIAPSSAGDVRYRDRRLLALYFDMTAMPAHDQVRAFNAAKTFVRTQMTASDLV